MSLSSGAARNTRSEGRPPGVRVRRPIDVVFDVEQFGLRSSVRPRPDQLGHPNGNQRVCSLSDLTEHGLSSARARASRRRLASSRVATTPPGFRLGPQQHRTGWPRTESIPNDSDPPPRSQTARGRSRELRVHKFVVARPGVSPCPIVHLSICQFRRFREARARCRPAGGLSMKQNGSVDRPVGSAAKLGVVDGVEPDGGGAVRAAPRTSGGTRRFIAAPGSACPASFALPVQCTSMGVLGASRGATSSDGTAPEFPEPEPQPFPFVFSRLT